jgi:hypothetical protein
MFAKMNLSTARSQITTGWCNLQKAFSLLANCIECGDPSTHHTIHRHSPVLLPLAEAITHFATIIATITTRCHFFEITRPQITEFSGCATLRCKHNTHKLVAVFFCCCKKQDLKDLAFCEDLLSFNPK